MELADIDLSLLLTLDVLLQERNVTRAAARLGVSQSALSSRLNRLRSVFADPLFVAATAGRGVVATPRAMGLKADLTDVLVRLQRLVQNPDAFEPGRTRRTFVVAAYENPALMLAPGLVSQVMAIASAAKLAFVVPGLDFRDRIESGEVDLLIAGPDKANGDLIQRLLFEDDFLTAQRRGHPRGIAPLELDEFCGLDHLLISQDGGGFAGMVDDMLAALGRTRRVRVSIQSYALAPAVLSAGDCVCTMPSRIFRRFEKEIELFAPPIELPPIKLFAYWHQRSHADPGHVWLRERIYEAAGRVRTVLPA